MARQQELEIQTTRALNQKINLMVNTTDMRLPEEVPAEPLAAQGAPVNETERSKKIREQADALIKEQEASFVAKQQQAELAKQRKLEDEVRKKLEKEFAEKQKKQEALAQV